MFWWLASKKKEFRPVSRAGMSRRFLVSHMGTGETLTGVTGALFPSPLTRGEMFMIPHLRGS